MRASAPVRATSAARTSGHTRRSRKSGHSRRFNMSDMSLSIWLSFLVCVTAYSPHDTFRYRLLSSRREESCSMCLGDECWALQSYRCQYYAEASEALGGAEMSIAQEGDIDGLVYDMVAQAVASWVSQECVPLVSQNTDCTKENICLGCKSCACDTSGTWRCQTVQRCRADPDLDVDHGVLATVMESIMNIKTRRKRSIGVKANNTGASSKINYAEISKWLHEDKPSVGVPHETVQENYEKHLKNRTTFGTATNKFNEIDADYIEFDEILNNIDKQINKKRKQLINYTDFDGTTAVPNNITDQFVNMLRDGNDNFLTDTEVEESTKVIIDLFRSLKEDKNNNFNTSDTININRNIIMEENYTDINKDEITFDTLNIMKRDVLNLNSTTETTEINIDNSKPVTELKNNVLIPLNKIIDDKQQELKDLTQIKENLVKFIKDYNNTNLDLNEKSQENLNGSNTVLSIYNLDIFPAIQFNLRKINPNILDKLLYKLKRDIYEVIRDVLGIKKLSNTGNLPDNLKTLIRAMSIYVRKQGNLQNDIKLKSRKSIDNESFNSTKDYLIKILQVLDKYTPQSEAVPSLSQTTRKIIKRVIKNHYTDDFSVIGLRGIDSEYNLTNDLRNVGSKWQLMTENIALSAPADKIYAMKLLHFTLSVDINKLNDALGLVNFAHSRRMIPIEEDTGEELLENINRGIKSIHEKVQLIMKYKKGLPVYNKEVDPIVKKRKRKSFLHKIRNLLKGSKKDIAELVSQKVPRSEIIQTIAKKKLDEIAHKRLIEYQNTMRKWQKSLNVISRHKRSMDRIKNRMKSIIPKYLRGKLNPALAAKRSKKTHRNTQNRDVLKKHSNTKQDRLDLTSMKVNTEKK